MRVDTWIDDGSPATMRGARARVRETDEGLATGFRVEQRRALLRRARDGHHAGEEVRARSFVRSFVCVVSRAGICVMCDLRERGKGREETDEKTDETRVAIF